MMEAGMYHPDGPSGLKELVLQLLVLMLRRWPTAVSSCWRLPPLKKSALPKILSPSKSNPHFPTQNDLERPAFLAVFCAWTSLLHYCLTPLISFRSQLRCHLIREAFPDLFSWSSTHSPLPSTPPLWLPVPLYWFHFLHNSYHYLTLFRYLSIT